MQGEPKVDALMEPLGFAAPLGRELRAVAGDLATRVYNKAYGIVWGLVRRLEDLERDLAAERQARVRLQHELKKAADGRPFDPEVR